MIPKLKHAHKNDVFQLDQFSCSRKESASAT